MCHIYYSITTLYIYIYICVYVYGYISINQPSQSSVVTGTLNPRAQHSPRSRSRAFGHGPTTREGHLCPHCRGARWEFHWEALNTQSPNFMGNKYTSYKRHNCGIFSNWYFSNCRCSSWVIRCYKRVTPLRIYLLNPNLMGLEDDFLAGSSYKHLVHVKSPSTVSPSIVGRTRKLTLVKSVKVRVRFLNMVIRKLSH